MNRREILKYAAFATGAAVSAPLISSLLVGCKSDVPTATVENATSFFGQKGASLVKNMVDLILPKTDSPSASEVGVHQMIEQMVGTVYKEKDRVAYKNGFDALASYLDKAGGEKGFVSLEAEKKAIILNQLDASKDETLKDIRKAYLDLKQQTIAYYLTTEEIGTKYLTYLPVPGNYEACVSLEEVGGKAWAI